MNLAQTFEDLFNSEQTAIAVITEKYGNLWRAETQTGDPLVLSGSTEVGKTVFYDMRTGKITGEAPPLRVIDINV